MIPYFYIGYVRVSNYYLAMFAGYVFMVILMLLNYRRKFYNLNPIKSITFATIVLILGILGCKLLFILENIMWVKKHKLTFGGFSFYGAALLMPLFIPLFGRLLHLNVQSSLDCSAICIVAMLGTIRIGCFLNGCCGGKVFSFERFDFSFPTQIIESACDFLILTFLLQKEKKRTFKGLLYPLFLISYGTIRFFLEFIRNTDKNWIGLSHAQWFSIISVIIGILFLFHSRKIVRETVSQ